MSERHPDGFLEISRRAIGHREPDERRADYGEIYAPQWQEAHLRGQGQRCMDCGVPACMSGCPIGNLIPEWNDLIYEGRWRHALARLHATNNFPEFTGYTCPAPCEPACTLAYNDEAVTIKSIERAIVATGWRNGWIHPEPPAKRTAFEVAVVGSGPAGLAAAQQLNRAGHRVTVFERDDVAGGLMCYGIPDFKFDKHRVAQRIAQMTAEGVVFKTNTPIGANGVPLQTLEDQYDAVCLAIGAQRHRQLPLPGAELGGVVEGMDYLKAENCRQRGRRPAPAAGKLHARGHNVVVLGGGDTGADCVATAHRQGARQVVQISIRQKPPERRPADNPWPLPPQVYERSYAQEEGGEEAFGVNTLAIEDTNGDGRVDQLRAEKVVWTFDRAGRRVDKTVLDPALRIPAELVLIAIGFDGPESGVFAGSGLAIDEKGNFAAGTDMMSSRPGVFVTGDARMGASLVVWAIGDGRDVARQIDTYLMGSSRLPASLQTANGPTPLR